MTRINVTRVLEVKFKQKIISSFLSYFAFDGNVFPELEFPSGLSLGITSL